MAQGRIVIPSTASGSITCIGVLRYHLGEAIGCLKHSSHYFDEAFAHDLTLKLLSAQEQITQAHSQAKSLAGWKD